MFEAGGHRTWVKGGVVPVLVCQFIIGKYSLTGDPQKA